MLEFASLTAIQTMALKNVTDEWSSLFTFAVEFYQSGLNRFGQPYIVTEYLDSETSPTVRKVLEQMDLSPGQLSSLVDQLYRISLTLFTIEVAHCDMSVNNVVIQNDSPEDVADLERILTIRVLDFADLQVFTRMKDKNGKSDLSRIAEGMLSYMDKRAADFKGAEFQPVLKKLQTLVEKMDALHLAMKKNKGKKNGVIVPSPLGVSHASERSEA